MSARREAPTAQQAIARLLRNCVELSTGRERFAVEPLPPTVNAEGAACLAAKEHARGVAQWPAAAADVAALICETKCRPRLNWWNCCWAAKVHRPLLWAGPRVSASCEPLMHVSLMHAWESSIQAACT